MTDMYEKVNGICLPIMKRFFSFRENLYNFRNFPEKKLQKIKTVRYDLETALFCTPQLCYLFPLDINPLPNVNLFKSKIKHWICTVCSPHVDSLKLTTKT